MNCLNSISSGIHNNKKVNNAFVTFNIPLDSQFFKQTTANNLYDVYTIVGQSAIDGSEITWGNKTVVATFTTNIPKIIQYVCVGDIHAELLQRWVEVARVRIMKGH